MMAGLSTKLSYNIIPANSNQINKGLESLDDFIKSRGNLGRSLI